MHSQSIRSVRAFSTDAKNSLRSCWELQCRKLECCVKDDYIPGVELRALLMKEAACRHLQHGTLVLSPRATGTGPANLSIVRALCMFASRSHPPLPAHSRTAFFQTRSRLPCTLCMSFDPPLKSQNLMCRRHPELCGTQVANFSWPGPGAAERTGGGRVAPLRRPGGAGSQGLRGFRRFQEVFCWHIVSSARINSLI